MVRAAQKKRVCVLVLDSLGIGESQDALTYGDAGANTFGHIFEACQNNQANQKGLREGALHIPHLTRLGLCHATVASSASTAIPLSQMAEPEAYFGFAVENSLGKDTSSGHWEIAGVPVPFDWGYFPTTIPCFPEKLTQSFIEKAGIPGILGNKHASGTDIIKELGEEHIRSGKPIVYTSADSVFQIAAHEVHFGLERLYEISLIARKLVDEYQIGRVIARPFTGKPGEFRRTGNRRDYAVPPPDQTLLDDLKAAGREVIAIGKIADIFAHRGITETIKADGNMALFDATLKALDNAPDGSLIFTNFVDFDSSYGHRRDVAGYAHALEAFDKRLPELMQTLGSDDLMVLTADHGCDPTYKGTDHTREHIPVLVYGKKLGKKFIGRRDSFADIGQSLAQYLGLPPLKHGISFL